MAGYGWRIDQQYLDYSHRAGQANLFQTSQVDVREFEESEEALSPQRYTSPTLESVRNLGGFMSGVPVNKTLLAQASQPPPIVKVILALA
jgi:hypothetical protein